MLVFWGETDKLMPCSKYMLFILGFNHSVNSYLNII